MLRRDRTRRLALTLALIVPAGCVPFPTRTKPPASTSFLETGGDGKVSGRQAADVQFAIGKSQEEEGHLEQAEAAYRSALARDPSRSDAQARLAILAERRGDPAGSSMRFDLALKIDPKNPEIHCDRGYSHYLRRRFKEAEASLRSALASDGSHARSHNNLGLVLAARGDKEGAIAEFVRAGCDEADARANLGLVLAMEGRYAEAREQYALAVRSKPGSRAAVEGLRVAAAAMDGGLRPDPAGSGRALASAAKTPAAASTADSSIRRASFDPEKGR